MLFRSNDTATTEIYTVGNTLSLHDALLIWRPQGNSRLEIQMPANPKAAGANPRDFIDNHFLQEIEDSGFVRELYGRR